MSSLIMKIPGSPAPGANLKKLQRRSTVIASDEFTGRRADLNGTDTDSGRGGNAKTWKANPTAYRTDGGYLRTGNNTAGAIVGAGIEVGPGNIRGTMGISGLPAGSINLDFRKNQIDNGAIYSPCYRLRVNPQGLVELLRKPLLSSPSYTLVSTGKHILTVPGSVGLEIYNRELSIQIDGKTVETWNEENTIIQGNYFELIQSSGFSIYADWIKFELLQ